MPIIAARIGTIKTNCFLRAFLSILLSYKGLEVKLLPDHLIGKSKSEQINGSLNCQRKQFRMKQLMNAGVIQRNKGRFSLTCLGVVVHHAQTVIEDGVKNYWKLKAIDSIDSSAEIGEHEREKLIKTIIDDSGIESILVSQRSR
jgi:hypothetical protein